MSGLRRYGQDEAALRVTAATLDAARGFRNGRLPEFIAGAQRLPGDQPTRTPRADPMQAWSAGTAACGPLSAQLRAQTAPLHGRLEVLLGLRGAIPRTGMRTASCQR